MNKGTKPATKYSHHDVGERHSVFLGWPEDVLLPYGRYKLTHTAHSLLMVNRYVWKDNLGKKKKEKLPGITVPDEIEVTPANLVEVCVSQDFRRVVTRFLVTLPYDDVDDLCLASDMEGNILTIYLRYISRRNQVPVSDSFTRPDAGVPIEREESNGE